jgi:hypothetical protein
MGLGLVIGFIELLQFVTTNKDYAVTVLHISQISIGHNSLSYSVTIFTGMVAIPLPLGSQTIPRLICTATADND